MRLPAYLAAVWLPALMAAAAAGSAPAQESAALQDLDRQLQSLKEEALELNHELSLLEERLRHPADTEVAVFVSLQPAETFSLGSVKLEIDGQPVASHVYSYRELEALRKGGVQRLHTGNLRTGEHDLRLLVRGKADGEAFERSSEFRVDKRAGPAMLELRLTDTDGDRPSLQLKRW